jgi:hypothetical protein
VGKEGLKKSPSIYLLHFKERIGYPFGNAYEIFIFHNPKCARKRRKISLY